MQKLIFLGYVVDLKETKKYSGISIAGNKMQWNVLKELAESGKLDIECLTVSPMAAFPKEKKIRQKKETSVLFGCVRQTKIPYSNFPIFKQFSQINAMYKTAAAILKKNPDAILFGFNQFPQVGIPMRKLKKKFPLCKTVSLLADLPFDDKTDRKGFSKWLRARFDRSTWKSIAACERFIVLNDYVGKHYVQGKPYVVVDGGVDEQDVTPYTPIEKAKKNILFCGALTEYNGILELLQAMELVRDSEITLDVYGGGYLEEYVVQFAKAHANVVYHGRVENKEVMQKQREAWLLINPRRVDDLIAKVTFPSKTFEYMLSGTPILTTRLNGYGAEYQDKMFFIEKDDAQGIADAISEMVNKKKEDLSSMTRMAHEFIVRERSWNKQVKTIMEFLGIK